MTLPLILLHGALGSKSQLEKLKNQLAADYKVYSMDFSGHGGRTANPNGYQLSTFADELADFMNEHQLTKANIFGYSMGGYVALLLAKKSPEKVHKILTLGTKFDWTPESSAKEVKMLNPDAIEAKVPHFAEMLAERHAPLDWKSVLNSTASMMLGLGNGEAVATADWQQVQRPVQLMLGELDNMVTQAETKAVQAALPNASFKILPQTKHPIEKVDVQLLANEIHTFFND